MFDPAATAERNASDPECMKVPSPMFCTKCFSSTKGEIPSHCAPSPPICVTPAMSPTWSGSMSKTMAWQPIPAPTNVPSATLVELLCGHPEQKYGLRTASGSSMRPRLRPLVSSQFLASGIWW